MEIKETIKELKVIKEFFEEQSGGCCPLCILSAIEYLEIMEGGNGTKN